MSNPCLSCGACCASFRVSFYWNEPEAAGLRADMREQLTPHLACLRGTNASEPHCAALCGTVGQQVGCTVYEHRPSPCREVQIGDEKCLRARAIHGLGSLEGSVPAGG